jgi:hypothetical protein
MAWAFHDRTGAFHTAFEITPRRLDENDFMVACAETTPCRKRASGIIGPFSKVTTTRNPIKCFFLEKGGPK